MSEFFKSKGFKVLVAVFVLIFGIMIASFLHNGTATTVDRVVGIFVTPVRSVTSAIGNFFSDIGDSFRSRSSLQREVDALTEENTELIGKLVDYEEMKRENEQLRELIRLQESGEEMTFCFASVISHTNDPYSNTVGLDKGSLDGVKAGDPVVTKDSVLVGYVSSLGDTWCTVTTLLDVTTNVGVRLTSSREVGVTECDMTLSKQGKICVAYLPKDSTTSRGEPALTSGLSGHYPAGLLVGTVDAVSLADDGLSAQAILTPAADVYKLTDVFVITSFSGQGEAVGE